MIAHDAPEIQQVDLTPLALELALWGGEDDCVGTAGVAASAALGGGAAINAAAGCHRAAQSDQRNRRAMAELDCTRA